MIARGYIKVFRTLLEHVREKGQAIADLQDHSKRTPLMTATIFDRTEVLQKMHDYGYNLRIDSIATRSVDLAIESGRVEVCSYYLDKFQLEKLDLTQNF